MKKINLKENRAITLIALVVTIIVLIILAAVSINLILGQNGILTKAKEGRENYEIAAEDEKRGMNTLFDDMAEQVQGDDGETVGKFTLVRHETHSEELVYNFEYQENDTWADWIGRNKNSEAMDELLEFYNDKQNIVNLLTSNNTEGKISVLDSNEDYETRLVYFDYNNGEWEEVNYSDKIHELDYSWEFTDESYYFQVRFTENPSANLSITVSKDVSEDVQYEYDLKKNDTWAKWIKRFSKSEELEEFMEYYDTETRYSVEDLFKSNSNEGEVKNWNYDWYGVFAIVDEDDNIVDFSDIISENKIYRIKAVDDSNEGI